MSSQPTAALHGSGLFASHRRDAWWVQPLLSGLAFGGFIVYSMWAAFQNRHFLYTGGGAHYLSPFYSPDLHELFGRDLFPRWLPSWIPHSPAFLILWAPAGFRLTCYYYRKAYYRSYFLDPPGCAVGEARGHGYRGEASFPLILQNAHRYFLYLALLFLPILAWDAIRAFWFAGDGFGIGLGSLVLTANALLLSGYTFGCHSLRHLVGGRLDCFTCSAPARVRHGVWRKVTWFNDRHQLWAWCSLFCVGFADLYVRLCAAGVISDPRLL